MRSFLIILVLYTAAMVASTAYSSEEFAYLQEESIPPLALSDLALSDEELAVTPPAPAPKQPEPDIFTGIGDWLEARFEKKNEAIPAAYMQIALQQSLPRNCTPLPGQGDCSW